MGKRIGDNGNFGKFRGFLGKSGIMKFNSRFLGIFRILRIGDFE